MYFFSTFSVDEYRFRFMTNFSWDQFSVRSNGCPEGSHGQNDLDDLVTLTGSIKSSLKECTLGWQVTGLYYLFNCTPRSISCNNAVLLFHRW